jgi:4-hydroxyphenylpyruvate dioxygenase
MKIDYVHFYLEDAKTWRDWFVQYLGFQSANDYIIPPHYNLGTGTLQHTCTEVVKSGSVCFVLSSPLSPTSPVAKFLHQHTSGVADVAFCVHDVEQAIAIAQAHGAKVLQSPQEYQLGKWCKIAAWGSLSHTLIERSVCSSPANLEHRVAAIDHIVLNVPAGELANTVTWYQNILGLQPQQSFNIQTDRSALHSQVMVSQLGDVQLPINQPTTPNSQIQEFLNINRGAGIQHIALRTPNIIHAIAQFRSRGLSFLSVPNTYYEKLKTRSGFSLSSEELEAIREQQILVDWKDASVASEIIAPLLLQIFTQPIFGKPTFFFEFIERRFQAQGFGEGNFRALFEAMESEQMKRGSL